MNTHLVLYIKIEFAYKWVQVVENSGFCSSVFTVSAFFCRVLGFKHITVFKTIITNVHFVKFRKTNHFKKCEQFSEYYMCVNMKTHVQTRNK